MYLMGCCYKSLLGRFGAWPRHGGEGSVGRGRTRSAPVLMVPRRWPRRRVLQLVSDIKAVHQPRLEGMLPLINPNR